ncbi:unnamed protein product [Adineta steineri]|uniref:Uncharacterized protein n=1 Tax=Adineta steineri TaxID=433720 RepID=A0A813R641_9BILA|nr:unnamed protein product [Adineta steineri]
MMKSSSLKFHILYLIILTYDTIIIDSYEYVEIMNENYTNILYNLKDEFILKQDTQDIIIDASGTTESSSSLDSTISVTLSSIETSMIEKAPITTLAMATDTTEPTSTTTSTTRATATETTEPTTTTTTTTTTTETASDTITTTTTTTTPTNITDATTTETTSDTITSATTNTSSSLPQLYLQLLHLQLPQLTSTTIPIVCNDITEVEYPNNTCISKSEAQRNTYGLLKNNTGTSVEKAGNLSLYFSSIARPNAEIDGNYVLNPNDINGIVKNLTDIKDPINSTASLIVLRSFDGNRSNTNFGASFLHGVGGRTVENINDSQISRMDMSIAGIATNIDSDNIKSLNILIIDDPFTYENFSTSSTKRLASSVVVMTAVQKSAFRSLVPMNIDLYFNDHSHEGSKIIETYKCGYYNTTALAWNEIGCSERNFNSNSKGYKCSFSHTATFAFLTFNCENTTHTIHNCNCGLKSDIQNETYRVIRSNSTNATIVANALSGYISSITNSNVSPNTANTLSLNEIDEVIDKLINSTVEIDTTASYITVQPPKQQNISDDVIVLGASVNNDTGGQIVDNKNKNNIIQNPGLLAAAIINEDLLNRVTSLNILIIKDPTPFLHADNSSNKTLASSLVVVSVRGINDANAVKNITLYFQLFNESEQRNDRTYLCSYYNTTTFTWDEAGCSVPTYNESLKRYQCSCNHFTSFALIWLPKQSLTSYLNSQDIASLVFQSISIVCFLLIIIHAMFRTIQFPLNTFQIYTLLPLISAATTTILFIFYIALSMTVYTQTSSSHQTNCFTSSTVLMFFTYFFLIFMFCVKTSVGYFNYLRFIHLFPQPSHRKLFIMLFISFFISLIWMAFAVGFYSDSSLDIIKLYPYKLCWFRSDVIYYFLSIPACLFLLINIILFIIVGSHIINHVRNATSVHQSYERMKRCVIVLLSSCITQGIGWLFGVFISFVNGESGYILGWFFVIFNGLEGLWSIILYMIIRSQHMDEQKRITAYKKFTESTPISTVKSKESYFNDSVSKRPKKTNRNSQKNSHVFNRSYNIKGIDGISSEC